MPEPVGTSDRTRIQLCGRLSVEVDGAELAGSLRGKQVRLLLAYLVLARQRPVGREELIGALWPHNPPRSQDAALRTLLSRLRSSLGAETLVGRDELVLELPEPTWIDIEAAVTHVERALAALEAGDTRRAWALAQVPLNVAGRGLLPGVQASWLESKRRELHDVRLQALEIIGQAGLALGGTQLSSVERAARALIEDEPYRESGYVLLMQSLRTQGNVAEALRVFERLRRLLRDELGTAPSPEALRAHAELLHPVDAKPSSAGGADPGEGVSGTVIPLPDELRARAAPSMIGRVAELSELERWLAAVKAGAQVERVLLLSGDPGVGKTRLLAEIASVKHASGTLVLGGRSPEETVVPFQAFLEALGHYVANAPVQELRAAARGHGAELARLVPALRRRLPELPQTEAGDLETERYRLFESVAGLLGELSAQRPVLIVLDDVQWADRPTLMLLRHLARAHQAARLSIIGAYRGTELGSESFASAMTGLRHERLVKQIEVSGLPERDTARLVGLRLGQRPDEDFIHALHVETEGNPFFIEEILRHLVDAGVSPLGATAADLARIGVPDDVRQVISRRLEHLSPEALESLRVAAVIGRDFDAGLLERVVEMGEERYLAGLEEALKAGLIYESTKSRGSYAFAHALIRETIYEGMARPRRARIHRRIGLVVEARGPQRHANALAYHFTQAAEPEDADRAIRYALQASEEASRMLAHEQAAEHYSGALELLARFHPEDREQRCRLLLALGETLGRSGERPRAWSVFRQAAAIAAELGDWESMAQAAIGASRRHVQPPGVIDEDLIAMLEQALQNTVEPSVTRVLLLTRLAASLYFSDRREYMRRLAAEATVLAAQLGEPLAAALAAAARRRAYWGPGHLERRLADSTQVLRAAREAGDLELTLQGHAWLVVDLLETGDRAGVEAQIEAFTVGARQLRQPLFSWQAAVWRAMRALLAGHLTTADRLAGEALSTGIRAEGITAPQYYSIQLLAIRREQDRLAELEDPVRELVRNNPHRPAWRALLGLLLIEAGRREEARTELAGMANQGFTDIPLDGDWLIAMTLLADVAVALQDPQWSQLVYQQLLPYANTIVVIGLAAVCLGSTARYLGRLALVMGERSTGCEHLERALAVNVALGAPVQAAHAQLDLVPALGRGERARELNEAASRTARELGIPALARRVR